MRISINRKDIKRIAAGKPKSEGGEFTELEIELAKYNERLFVAFGKTSDERNDLFQSFASIYNYINHRMKGGAWAEAAEASLRKKNTNCNVE